MSKDGLVIDTNVILQRSALTAIISASFSSAAFINPNIAMPLVPVIAPAAMVCLVQSLAAEDTGEYCTVSKYKTPAHQIAAKLALCFSIAGGIGASYFAGQHVSFLHPESHVIHSRGQSPTCCINPPEAR